MNTVIFLDVDGVLNGYSTKDDFNDSYLSNLHEFITTTHADVVLSSSWLYYFRLTENGFEPKSRSGFALQNILTDYDIEIKELLYDPDDYSMSRWDAIADYLDNHDYEKVIILDDETPTYDYLKDYWIKTLYGERLPTDETIEGFNNDKLDEALAVWHAQI